MIEEIPITNLDPRQVKQVDGADKALISNPSYSKEIYSAILKLAPGCLEVRKKLRNLQFRIANKNTKGLFDSFGRVAATPLMFRGKGDKNPEEALAKAEELIDKSVTNIIAHQILVEAAIALEMKQTAIFGLKQLGR